MHVVIIGLDGHKAVPGRKRLFSYPDINGDPQETRHAVLSPYLFDAGGLADPHLSVREESAPANGLPKLISGSQPIDNGQYIFSSEQARDEFLSAEPAAAPFLRPYVSALDYLRNRHRWILALHDAPPNVLAGMPMVRERIARVREFRSRSKRKQTLMLADYPTRYNVNGHPDRTLPRGSRGQFGAAGLRSHRLAGAAADS